MDEMEKERGAGGGLRVGYLGLRAVTYTQQGFQASNCEEKLLFSVKQTLRKAQTCDIR